MKKIIIPMLIGLALPFIALAQSPDSVFLKAPNWHAVMDRANKEGKNIFIDFMATWCAPCHAMDRYVYSDSNVKEYLKANFISIKIQADRTSKDSPTIVAWYKEADSLVRTYSVNAFPTFVFLSPKGELLAMDFGYQDAPKFLDILSKANDPHFAYYKLMNDYKQNKLSFSDMLPLAVRSKQYKDSLQAAQIVQKYKSQYFDKLALKDQLSKAFTDLAFHFPFTIKETDPVVRYIYLHPGVLDSAFRPNLSKDYLSYFIHRDYINPIVAEAEQKGMEPAWVAIQEKVAKRYDPTLGSRLTAENQLSYYYRMKNWDKAIKMEIENIEKKGIQNAVNESTLQVNNLVFDLIFKKTNNPEYLKKAQIFMEAVLAKGANKYEQIDTYANVLYKLGQKNKAIQYEEKALMLAKEKKDERSIRTFENVLQLMKSNQPTWPTE